MKASQTLHQRSLGLHLVEMCGSHGSMLLGLPSRKNLLFSFWEQNELMSLSC